MWCFACTELFIKRALHHGTCFEAFKEFVIGNQATAALTQAELDPGVNLSALT